MENPKSRVLAGAVLLAFAAVCGSAAMSHAASGDFISDHVLGQADLRHNMLNFGGPQALAGPGAIAADRYGHLWIADTNNNRVLGYFSGISLVNGASADIVIGQPDFFSYQSNHGAPSGSVNMGVGPDALSAPQGVAVDGAGNLYVADTGNSRVLEYDSPFNTCSGLPCAGLLADRVFGQNDNFKTSNCGLTADNMCFPQGLALDANGNLYVADTLNSRVLEFQQPLANGGGTPGTPGSAGDTTADLVFGQNGSFTTSGCNNGAGPGDVSGYGPDSLCHPLGLAIDSGGNLFVADSHDSRILVYEAPLQANPACIPAANGSGCPGDTIADLVFGQAGSFYSLLSGVGPDLLAEPVGLALDSSGDLFAVDTGNDRVLEYDNPLAAGGGTPATPGSAGDTTADRVFGQASFAGSFTSDCVNGKPTPSATSLCQPASVAVDLNGNAFVTDHSNNRVVEYFSPLHVTAAAGSGDTTADIALGQADLSHNMVNFGGPRAIGNPGAVTIDYAGHLYVIDQLNNRVLGFSNANKFVDGAAADILIGQPDFFSYGANHGTAPGDLNGLGADSLSAPSGMATDSLGNLYVADGGNSRVLEYNAPFSACASPPCTGVTANLVIGQSAFSANSCNHGNGANADAYGLCFPHGLATDTSGNLYVADTDNSRVVEFTAPLSNGTMATRVFGQPNLFASGCLDGTAPGDIQGVGPDSLCAPAAVALDINGNLYIADSGDSRILEYNTPVVRSNVKGSGDTVADLVFGQNGSFTSRGCFITGATADTLCDPIALTLDLAGNLYVSDGRLLEYNVPLSTDTTADVVIDNSDLALGPDGFAVPVGLALDVKGNLFLADFLSQGSLSPFIGRRVLEYDKPIPTSVPVTKLALKPKTVNFDEVPVGTTSAPVAATISNSGNTAGLIGSVTISGNFAIVANQCPLVLPPGASCSVSVTFTPAAAGTQSGTLSFVDNDAGSPQTVTLSGNGK